MDEAEAEVLAFMSFPKAHRVQIHSTDAIDKSNAAAVAIDPVARLLGPIGFQRSTKRV